MTQTVYQYLITLPFTVCLFWTVVLALGWRTSSAAKRVLAVFMAVSTVLYLCHAVFFIHSSCQLLPVADSVYSFCNLAVFPLYYLYIYRLTKGRITLHHALLLLPAVVLGASTALLYAFGGSHAVRLAVCKAVFALQLAAVSYCGFRHLLKFDSLIDNNYSCTEQRSVKHTR